MGSRSSFCVRVGLSLGSGSSLGFRARFLGQGQCRVSGHRLRSESGRGRFQDRVRFRFRGRVLQPQPRPINPISSFIPKPDPDPHSET